MDTYKEKRVRIIEHTKTDGRVYWTIQIKWFLLWETLTIKKATRKFDTLNEAKLFYELIDVSKVILKRKVYP